MNDYIAAPTTIAIDGKPWWQFATGELLPVVRGGADDGDDGGDDDAGDTGDTGDDGTGDADDGDDNKPTPAQQLAAQKAEADKWKALARKHEKTAKQHSDAAEKLQALEHAGKSETEKLQTMLNDERSKSHTATVQALKLQVAADKGLPPSLAKFLPDLDDEVDMVAAADELLEAAGGADMVSKPTRQPKSNLTNPLKDGDGDDQKNRLIAAMTGKSPL